MIRKLMLIALGAATLTACASTIPAAGPADVAAGEALWQHRCLGCHEPGLPGTPSPRQLAALGAGKVFAALDDGKMADMARNLSDAEKRQIAAYVARRQFP